MLDVAVVGSGHNALVAACYLARAGWSVGVFERDSIFGGGVSTVERFPGHRVDRGSSAHLMVRHTGIVEELELARFGLRYLDCDPWAFAPAPPGSGAPPIVFRRSLDATCASIEAACGARDADAYRRFVQVWGPRSARVMRAFTSPPSAARFARAFWGLTPGGAGSGRAAPASGSALSREFLTSGDALLDEWFDDERLKAALAWFGAQSGPPMSEPGTAPMVGFAALMHDLPPGRAVGGSGALTEALVARLRADGGQVHTSSQIDAVQRTGDHWVLAATSGEQVAARTVVAGCHVLTTLDLLERGGHDRSRLDAWRRRIRVGPGIGMVVRVATSDLPQYPGVDVDDSARGLQLLVPDRRLLHAAHGAALAGELPPEPAVLAMSFSALDPSIAAPGEHQLSLWSQWHPYRLARGSWAERAEQEADRIVGVLDGYAPGFADTVRHRFVQSPVDIETELGMLGGNVMHVEMALDQMFFWRPLPELSGHRMPGAPGLYLTGASTHPGGGVSGASGRSAARVALADARRGRVRRLLRIRP